MRHAKALVTTLTALSLAACGTAGGFEPSPSANVGDPSSSGQQSAQTQSQTQTQQNSQTGASNSAALVSSEQSANQPTYAPDNNPTKLNPAELGAGAEVSATDIQRAGGEDAFFWVEPIPDDVFARMQGKSFGADCTIPRDNLRYVRVLHVNAEGVSKVGELVVNKSVADEVLDIFHQLYDAKWPIKKMHLVDDYDGSDDASCADGNTAAFNFRMASNANVLSNHAYGVAIDINTFENPYYIPETDYVFPPEAVTYVNRTLHEPYMIHTDDLCYQLFTSYGWSWGGDWATPKDYQHFEKPSAI